MNYKKYWCRKILSLILAGGLIFGTVVTALANGSGKAGGESAEADEKLKTADEKTAGSGEAAENSETDGNGEAAENSEMDGNDKAAGNDETDKNSGTAEDSSDVIEKSETVYVKAEADGTAKEITVSEWLRNLTDEDVIEDYSLLSDIKNTEGDEEFTQNADGTILWENHGEDISYEGKSEEELPVSVKISYYLNGQQMSPEQIAGQSGEVKIRFDYENHTSRTVKADGKEVEVRIPFVMLSLVFLDSEVFSNVEVTNGKLMESQEQSIAVGYACPGLADSLKLASYEPTKEIEIPEYVEITADVTDFELEFTATVASTGMFEGLDTEDLDDAGDLADSMEEMQDASAEILDGIEELLDGTKEMGSYLDEYITGVSTLNSGTQKLKTGMGTLNSQKSALESGAAALQNGLESLNTALSQISLPAGGGTGSTDSSGEEKDNENAQDISGASQAAAALMEDGKLLASGLAQLQESMQKMQDFVGTAIKYQAEVENKVSAAKSRLESAELSNLEAKANEKARSQARSAVDSAMTGFDLGELEQSDPELAASIRAQLESMREGAKAQIDGTVDVSGVISESGVQEILNEVKGILGEMPSLDIPELSVDVTGIQSAAADMQKQLQILSAYAEAMSEMTGQLSGLGTALEELKSGVSQLADGSKQLTEGIKAYNQGVEQLYSAMTALSDGTNTLASAGGALAEGMDALVDGTEALQEGYETFDEEAIGELAELAGDDLRNMITRVRALKKADQEYNNYAGIREGSTGEVKFIIETGEI